MTASPNSDTPVIPARRQAPAAFRWLASLELAVVLIGVLAVVLAVATLIEQAHGRDYARWYVYGSAWFAAFLGLLGINILAATIARFPWKRRHFAFLITHAGLLVLLVGAIQSLMGGIDGQIVLQEGGASDRLVLNDWCRITTRWLDMEGRQDRQPAAFRFQPGPADWPEGKTLDLGGISGVQLEVTRYLSRARAVENWVADKTRSGPPAIEFALVGANGVAGEGQWLSAGQFGGLASVGPIQFEFQRVPAATMRDDFLKPPAKDMDPSGVLSIHYEGRMQRIPVSKNVGKKIPLSDGKVSVEVVEYLPNAKPDADLKFTSEGTEPKNPFVELRVYLPGEKEPIRQIAFANHPFQSLDGIHGRTSPVKFWFHHPATTADSGAQFMQTPDGKLYCRVGIDGKYQPQGEVKAGDRFALPAKFRAGLVKHLPNARREVTFEPAPPAAEEGGAAGAAVCLAVTAAGETREVWLKQNDSEYGIQRLATGEGPLGLACGYGDEPLGFSLQLLKFQRGLNPGGMGDASFASTVRLIDKNANVDEKHEISMNQPLVHGKFAFYQSGFDSTPDGKAVSVLSVAYDPGRFLKYLGSLMVCAGCALMFWRKSLFGKFPSAASGRGNATETGSAKGQGDSRRPNSGANADGPVPKKRAGVTK
ncbi:MAG: cytochrome c biogenesis protein ResB [Pirellulales bacterium]